MNGPGSPTTAVDAFATPKTANCCIARQLGRDRLRTAIAENRASIATAIPYALQNECRQLRSCRA
jgi:hypothetical protein